MNDLQGARVLTGGANIQTLSDKNAQSPILSISHAKGGILPIFIVGAWHSGTYLMLNILAVHSCLFVIRGETHYMLRRSGLKRALQDIPENTRWLHLLKALLSESIHPTFDLRTLEELAELLASFGVLDIEDLDESLCIMMATICSVFKKDMWIEKSPDHVAYLGQIKSAFPSARIVNMVRDPKAVMASTKIRSRVAGGKMVRDVYHPLHEAVTWKEAIMRGRAFAETYPESYLEVRYEDLVQRSEQVIRAVCAFLEIPFEEGMLQVRQVNPARVAEKGQSGFDKRPLSRWQDELDKSDLFILSKTCSHEMARLGYDVPQSKFPYIALFNEMLRFPIFMARKLTGYLQSPKEIDVGTDLHRLIRKYSIFLQP